MKSNAQEIRRVRREMSAEADHDIRKLVAMLAPLRDRLGKQLVNHGKAEACEGNGVAETTVSGGTPRA
ncbi:hypothetical protein OAF98_05965 [Planctomicrobium sp.]|jgi:hypothetical protein|nr:hypothetical protein [Planctomicrobium sp.]MBT5020448.1 hypothetical protein [Planctomicrobium sp.]MDB4744015.1 hypothetical protein [Planctomicrobium sp.]